MPVFADARHRSRALLVAVVVLAASAAPSISCGGGHCTVDSLVGCGFESPGVENGQEQEVEGGSDGDGQEQLVFDDAGVLIGIFQ